MWVILLDCKSFFFFFLDCLKKNVLICCESVLLYCKSFFFFQILGFFCLFNVVYGFEELVFGVSLFKKRVLIYLIADKLEENKIEKEKKKELDDVAIALIFAHVAFDVF